MSIRSLAVKLAPFLLIASFICLISARFNLKRNGAVVVVVDTKPYLHTRTGVVRWKGRLYNPKHLLTEEVINPFRAAGKHHVQHAFHHRSHADVCLMM